MATLEFTDTVQCPRCGEIYPYDAPHTCVAKSPGDFGVGGPFGKERTRPTQLADILAELRAIRKLLEKRR